MILKNDFENEFEDFEKAMELAQSKTILGCIGGVN